MAGVEDRLEKVEKRLDSVEGQVGGLRSEVSGLRGEVTGLRGAVTRLDGEVQKLRVLGEENERRINLVIEVQALHGQKLDEHSGMLAQITKALEPLAAIHAFIQGVAGNHEERITALEKRTGVR